jgi:hypothetical protein
VQVVQGAAVVTVALNLVAMWKQEPRDRARAARMETETHADFIDAWRLFVRGRTAVGLLVVIALGTMGFGMADVLLEPYGGHVLDLTVAMTTRLTAVLALGGLIGFAIASKVLLNGRDPLDVAWWGTLAGVPAFAAIIAAGPMGEPSLFVAGTWLAGLGAGLFGHGTLTATMRSAPREQVGLALGAWGAVQATAAGDRRGARRHHPRPDHRHAGRGGLPPRGALYARLQPRADPSFSPRSYAIMLLKRTDRTSPRPRTSSNRQVRPDTPAVITEPAPPAPGEPRGRPMRTHDSRHINAGPRATRDPRPGHAQNTIVQGEAP